jgi:hypothetical protein
MTEQDSSGTWADETKHMLTIVKPSRSRACLSRLMG